MMWNTLCVQMNRKLFPNILEKSSIYTQAQRHNRKAHTSIEERLHAIFRVWQFVNRWWNKREYVVALASHGIVWIHKIRRTNSSLAAIYFNWNIIHHICTISTGTNILNPINRTEISSCVDIVFFSSLCYIIEMCINCISFGTDAICWKYSDMHFRLCSINAWWFRKPIWNWIFKMVSNSDFKLPHKSTVYRLVWLTVDFVDFFSISFQFNLIRFNRYFIHLKAIGNLPRSFAANISRRK